MKKKLKLVGEPQTWPQGAGLLIFSDSEFRGLGFRVKALGAVCGFSIFSDFEFGIQGLGLFRVQGLGCMVYGWGFRVGDSGLRVQGVGRRGAQRNELCAGSVHIIASPQTNMEPQKGSHDPL